MPPEKADQTEAFMRFLFEQPLIHVMVIGLIVIIVILLIVMVLLIRLATRQSKEGTQVQGATLKVTADLVNVAAKLTDRVEALVDKTAMTGEQVTALSLIIASVSDSFGRFRASLGQWVKADYATKKTIHREMQELRTQLSLLNQVVTRMDLTMHPQKSIIRIPEAKEGNQP